MKYVIDHAKAMEIVKRWHDAPKTRTGTVTNRYVSRYSWVYDEKEHYGAIDNRAGLCEVMDGFQSKEEAEAWLDERGK